MIKSDPPFAPWAAPESAPADSVQRVVSLLADGIAAAEGAQVLAELYFEQQGRDPSNNDNYCRLMDWLKAARRHRDKQANTALSHSGDKP